MRLEETDLTTSITFDVNRQPEAWTRMLTRDGEVVFSTSPRAIMDYYGRKTIYVEEPLRNHYRQFAVDHIVAVDGVTVLGWYVMEEFRTRRRRFLERMDALGDSQARRRVNRLVKGRSQAPGWFWNTIHLPEEDSTNIGMYRSWKDVYTDRVQVMSFAKAMRAWEHLGFITLKPTDVDHLATLWGDAGLLTNQFTHVIGYGQEVPLGYALTPVRWGSCMTGYSPRLQFYAQYSERVGFVRFYKKAKWIGRALIWHTDDGTIYLDRIYPARHKITDHIKHYVKETQGWKSHGNMTSFNGEAVRGNKNLTVTLDVPKQVGFVRDYGGGPILDLPYFDSWQTRWVDDKHEQLQLFSRWVRR
jgi:hypothetical protein